MKVLITMAGEGLRFRKAGYRLPKHMLKANGETLFYWALSTLQDLFVECPFTFVVRTGQEGFVNQEAERLRIKDFEVIPLDTPTDGQATSAILGMKGVAESEPILIYNIDTHIRHGEQYFTLAAFSDPDMYGNIPYCIQAGDHWSFVEVDPSGHVIRIAEKNRISDKASIGMYYFRTKALFREAYYATYECGSAISGERYISNVYTYIIAQYGRVKGVEVQAQDFVPLGTPNEVHAFDRSFAVFQNAP